jgi:alpha-glucosidase
MTQLLHPPIAPWVKATADGLQLELLCDAAAPGSLYVRGLPHNEELLVPMQPAGRHGAWFRFAALLPWDAGNPLTLYSFVHAGPGGLRWLAADGLHALPPPESVQFRVHPHEQPPAWVREQVFYQVFPDRFACGGTPADRRGEQLHGGDIRPVVQAEWGAPVDPAHSFNTFFGGDLPGVAQRLPYLQDEVGASAIYLNPIFCAASNHRYDTTDYTQVDPHLGGNAALAALRGATAARGMRLVLDAVVNHTGADHPWFNRWGRHAELGAAQSPHSPYRERYVFDAAGRAPGWKGHASLPVLDFASPAVQQAIYGEGDSVLRRWLRAPYAIDGWRLDVIHMLGEGEGAHNNLHHVRAIRRAIKAENAAAYVLGEHFAEATRWLQGEPEDGAMNYFGFTQPLRAWLAGLSAPGGASGAARVPIDTAALVDRLVRACAAIPYANQLAQLNLLGSHDTTRLLHELNGDLDLMQLATTLLFTWPGVPCIYYGDEIGMSGGADPDNRRCFEWERARWQPRLLALHSRLAGLRRQRPEWRAGAVQILAQGTQWWAFARSTDASATLVVANRGPAVDVQLPLGSLPLCTAPRWVPMDGAAGDT